jgi:C4-dicarboxylate-specific signal transduction histidine kinase
MNQLPPPLDTVSRRHWLWWLPRLALVLFIASVALQLWLSERADHAEEQATLNHDLLWLEQGLRFNLKHNEETLGHISPTQATDPRAFAAYARSLLANNTGLRRIAYLDAQQRVQHSMPARPQALNEHADARLALSLGKPLYSPPFYDNSHAPGEWLFTVYVPSPATGGTIKATYALEKTLAEGVPWWLAQRNHISLRDTRGTILAKSSQLETTQRASLQRHIVLDPPGHGLSIWITPIRPPVPLSGKVLSITLVLLSILLLWSIWALRQHLQHRRNAERQLQFQHERLQTTSRLITMGEMASSLAHEINQPMAAISSYATGSLNLIDAGKTDLHEIRGALSRIQTQAQRAGHIIRRIYTFTRRAEPKTEACDLAQICQEVTDLLTEDARRKGIRITLTLHAGLTIIQGDAVLLGQVLFNLMRNGIEAMALDTRHAQHATGTNTLSLEAYAEGTQLHIDISDRGPGISPEAAARLFEPFYTSKPEGLGMGLNICRSIVEAHRGQLTQKAHPQGGTIFSIVLPITPP